MKKTASPTVTAKSAARAKSTVRAKPTARAKSVATAKPAKPVATAQKLERTVKGQELTSAKLPAVRLKFDKKFKYVGGQEFNLFGEAHAEQHLFVDADRQGRVKRMYWVQFESYLPNSKHTYTPKHIYTHKVAKTVEVAKTVDVGGLSFISEPSSRSIKADPGLVDSEGRHVRALLESKGYRMASDEALYQRLIHLPDNTKRNVMVIIYLEDMSGMGFKADDFQMNGRALDRWDEISKALEERALKGLKVSR